MESVCRGMRQGLTTDPVAYTGGGGPTTKPPNGTSTTDSPLFFTDRGNPSPLRVRDVARSNGAGSWFTCAPAPGREHARARRMTISTTLQQGHVAATYVLVNPQRTPANAHESWGRAWLEASPLAKPQRRQVMAPVPGRDSLAKIRRLDIMVFPLTDFLSFFCRCPPTGWEKIKLKLTTLPRIFMHVLCQFDSIAFAIKLVLLACPSAPVVATARAVPTGGHHCHYRHE